MSLVDDVLRERSAFGEMDFATRDRYRHAVEELARDSGLTELEIARRAAELAAEPAPSDAPSRVGTPAHRGRHRPPDRPVRPPRGRLLPDRGRPPGVRARPRHPGPPSIRLRRFYVRAAARGYLGSIAVVTALVLARIVMARTSAVTTAIDPR